MAAFLLRASSGRHPRSASAKHRIRLWLSIAISGSLLRSAQAGAEGWQPAHSSVPRPAVALPGAVEPSSQVAAADAVEEWQAAFSLGLQLSEAAVAADEPEAGRWTFDRRGSGAGVPARMLRSEEALAAGAAAAPEEQSRERGAERALRLYHHGRWLAERSHMRAAEWRLREASKVARECRRGVLAAHALARLGYFLAVWQREDEARQVLQQSERINTKANPLAPFLLGALDRQVAGGDMERLRAAEDRVLAAKEQPSEELEVERARLRAEIGYWRAAKDCPSCCLDTPETAYMVICFASHAARLATQAVTPS